MAFLVIFWLGLGTPAILRQNPNKLSFGQFRKKVGIGSDPRPPPWAKFPTFTENLFLGLPLVPMDCDVHCLLTEVENFSTDFGHVRSFGPFR